MSDENPTYEEIFPGGMYDVGEEYRTDMYVRYSEPAAPKPGERPEPLTVDIGVVTGNASITVVDIRPAKLIELGEWLAEMGRLAASREKMA